MRRKETARDYATLNRSAIVYGIRHDLEQLAQVDIENMSDRKLKRLAAALNNLIKDIEE